jgi:hypothetical protein
LGARYSIDAAELTVLSRMQSADSDGRPELAMLAVERLRERAWSEAEIRSLDIQESRIRPRLEESERWRLRSTLTPPSWVCGGLKARPPEGFAGCGGHRMT